MYTVVVPSSEVAIPVAITISSASATSTTLYDLMTAIQEAVSPDEDHLAIATIAYLFGSGRITVPSDAPVGEACMN